MNEAMEYQGPTREEIESGEFWHAVETEGKELINKMMSRKQGNFRTKSPDVIEYIQKELSDYDFAELNGAQTDSVLKVYTTSISKETFLILSTLNSVL